MELFTLDSNFQPVDLVENYESLIWTERYSTNGDFEIVTSDIAGSMKLLPRETCVSLRESNVPMLIESHKIVKPIRDRPTISITGRSFETVLDRRGSVNVNIDVPQTVTKSFWNIVAAKESDAAYLAMRIVLGDEPRYQKVWVPNSPDGAPPQGTDLNPYTGVGLGSYVNTMVLPLTNPAASVYDAIPEITLTLPADYTDILAATTWDAAVAYSVGSKVFSGGYVWLAMVANTNSMPDIAHPEIWTQISAWDSYEIKAQSLYTTVMDLINVNRRGLKAVRPESGSSKIGIEVYNGADLTSTVVFDARFDQIDDATYLLSALGSTNVAYVYGAGGGEKVLKNTVPTRTDHAEYNGGPVLYIPGGTPSTDPVAVEPSGLNRRVLILDQSSDTTSDSVEIRRNRGLIELYKNNATALFDGEVAEQVAAGYNTQYFLGDILKLVGEYGLSQNVRVAEFIRSADSSGEKHYPTFEAVDD